jgi:hypothetical protein
LPSNYGKSLNYQVATAKTSLISRGEHHSLSWQFLHIRDRKRVRSRQRSLLLRFPTQIETSASREVPSQSCRQDMLFTSNALKIRLHNSKWSKQNGLLFNVETGSKQLVILSYAIVCLHLSLSLNNKKFVVKLVRAYGAGSFWIWTTRVRKC